MIDLHFSWWVPTLVGGLVLALVTEGFRRLLKILRKLYEVLSDIAPLAEYAPTLAAMAEEFNTNGGSSLHETMMRLEKDVKDVKGKFDGLYP